MNLDSNSVIVTNQIRLPWYQFLSLLRESLSFQKQFKFRFVTDESSKTLIQQFLLEQRASSAARNGTAQILSEEDIEKQLSEHGWDFTKRRLKSFQVRDIARLTSIPNGANFSVPGAGKTTVTLAIHLLTSQEQDKLFVVCPKSAFPAWDEILSLCLDSNSGWPYSNGQFINLSNLTEREIIDAFSVNRYFVTNYEQFVSKKETFAFLIATNRIHLVLDESHRMKAGILSQRGASLLSIANLPKRKDILSGTPMPQSSNDLQSQIDFLWPGSSLGLRIQQGEIPSTVISGLYTRTTKEELGLPLVNRHFVQVPMSEAQTALYSVVRNEVLRQLSSFRNGHGLDIVRARKSVMRLLQLASNPILAVRGIAEDMFMRGHPLINAIMQNPTSPKIQEVCRLVRLNASNGRKTLVWTIFTQNILDLEHELSDLNPVSIYGAIKSGDYNDQSTREGRIKRFHEDDLCMVIIANPAAAGEGISLHQVCHEAIYLDRSYVSTHYLQSIDRIHRLGLPPGTETNITIVQAAPPTGIGSIDYSVSRRLATKIRALQQLLNDRDLHLVALDEENSPEAVDYNLDFDDVVDLIEELEGNAQFNRIDGA